MGVGPLEGLSAMEPEMHEGGPVWCAYLKIAPDGLDIGGTWRKPSVNDA